MCGRGAGARVGRSTKSATAIALLGIVFGCASALAAEDKSVPEVPAEDIFGFTSPTDIGNPGDIAFANENDGRLGKRDGRYRVLDTKYEFSRTLPDDWWIAGSLFGTFHHTRDVTGLPLDLE